MATNEIRPMASESRVDPRIQNRRRRKGRSSGGRKRPWTGKKIADRQLRVRALRRVSRARVSARRSAGKPPTSDPFRQFRGPSPHFDVPLHHAVELKLQRKAWRAERQCDEGSGGVERKTSDEWRRGCRDALDGNGRDEGGITSLRRTGACSAVKGGFELRGNERRARRAKGRQVWALSKGHKFHRRLGSKWKAVARKSPARRSEKRAREY